MMLRNCAALALVFALNVGSVLAQDDAPESSRSTSFQAVEGKQREQVPGGPLVVYAYGFVLLSLIVYVGRLGLMNAKNRGELERLTQAIERGRKA
jgi:hypothetical protein